MGYNDLLYITVWQNCDTDTAGHFYRACSWHRGGGYSGLIWTYFNFSLLEKFSICFLRANHYLILAFDLLTLQKIKIMRNDFFLFQAHKITFGPHQS